MRRRARELFGCCLALPIGCWAAQPTQPGQDNVLTIQHGGAATAGKTPASAVARQQAQPDPHRSAGQSEPARIVHREQRNFVEEAEPAQAVSDAATDTVAAPSSTAEDALSPTTAGSAAATPDERPLWRLLHEHRLAEYDRQVTQFEHDTPSWRPSPALAAQRAQQQREADIAAALQSGDPAALRHAMASAPDAFGCAHIDRAWQAADAFAQAGQPGEVDAIYRTLIPSCAPEENRIATLYRAQKQLPAEQVDALIALEAGQGRRDAKGEAAFARLRYERAIAVLGKTPPDAPEAARRLTALAPSIRAYQDGPAATLAGWIALAHQDTKAAKDWFETALKSSPDDVDAKLGLAQVRIDLRAYDAAESLLDAPAVRDDARARRARAQIALARANDAYGRHRYEAGLKWLDAAVRDGLPAVDAAGLRGWALYAIRRYDEAAAAFRLSYDARHDDDSAEGLAMSMHALDKSGVQKSTAAMSVDRRVAAYLDALDAQARYYRKQFNASNTAMHDALNGPADPQRIARYVPADLTGIDAPSLTGGFTWSDHIGAGGQGRLNTVGADLHAQWFHDTTQLALQYRQWFINAGTTSLDSTLPGSLGILDNQATQDERAGLNHNERNWMVGGSARAEELQATLADSARIGSMPHVDWRLSLGGTQGGSVPFQPNAFGSIAEQTPWGTWMLYGGVMPVRDSLLSWRGMALPEQAGGNRWGAVRRTSGGARLRWQPAPRWNVGGAIEGQWLTGTNVVGNEGMSADLSASYDFRLAGFDYFSAGPALHYLSYRRNENFYSWGQGGYYSPQSSISTGLALQWLTDEGRTWQARGSVETGWNDSLQHTERCFPLGLDAGLASAISSLPGQGGSNSANAISNLACAGGHDHGPYASAAVTVVAKLSSRLQLGGSIDVNVTPGRDRQFGAGVFIRYFLEPRAAVFSSDLPSGEPQ